MVLAFHLYLLEPWRLQGWLSTCAGLRTATSCPLFDLMVTCHLHDCVIQWNKSTGTIWKNVFEKLNIFLSFSEKMFHSFIYFAAPGLSCGIWDLFPWPGLEPGLPASGVQSLSHWATREVLKCFLKVEPKLFRIGENLATAKSKCCGYLVNWWKSKATPFFFFFNVCVEFYSMDVLLFSWYYWWIFVSIHDALLNTCECTSL